MELARPWPKGLKMEFGLGSAIFGISGINLVPFPGVQNNAYTYKLDLDRICITPGGRLELGCHQVDLRSLALYSLSTGEGDECRQVRVGRSGGCRPRGGEASWRRAILLRMPRRVE